MGPDNKPISNSLPQVAKAKKTWQRPEIYLLDTNEINANKHLNYTREANFSGSAPAPSFGAFKWYSRGPGHVGGLHGSPLKSIVS